MPKSFEKFSPVEKEGRTAYGTIMVFSSGVLPPELLYGISYNFFTVFLYWRNMEWSILERERLFKTALISILIDSFAHNIAAHALSGIEAWLNRRLQYWNHPREELRDLDLEDKTFYDYEPKKLTYSKLIRYKWKELPELSAPILPPSLDDEWYKFMCYLHGKAFFWSGVVQEEIFGGDIVSWFDILFEFADNPFFIGNITALEGYRKVKFIVHLNNKKYEFLEVDLSGLLEEFTDEEKLNFSEDEDDIYYFIRECNDFNTIKNKLKNRDVFLPGGVVGKHALYTVFENVLRNVKWTEKSGDTLEFHIKIENGIEGLKKKTYTISLWLGNPSKENAGERANKMNEDTKEKKIIDEHNNPRMGGIYQTKICACYLFTGSFVKVEDEGLKVNGKELYPWARYGIEKNNNNEECIKTYLYLWKGKKCTFYGSNRRSGNYEREDPGLLVDRKRNVKDHIGRYKLVVVDSKEKMREVESRGIIRVVEKSTVTEKRLKQHECVEYYKKWLKGWLENCECDGCTLVIEPHDGGRSISLEWDGGNCKWNKGGSESNIRLSHGEVGEKRRHLIYRTHGALKEFIEFGKKEVTATKNEEKHIELAEVLFTRVAIIDDRVSKRLNEYGKQSHNDGCGGLFGHFKNKLQLMWWTEDKEWEEIKKEINSEAVHFLVLHLGYIETIMKKRKGDRATDELVVDFIKENIKFDGEEGGDGEEKQEQKIKVRKLFITTGRGRYAWLEKIRKNANYKRHVFKLSPYSLERAVEQGIRMWDDFQIKYGIVKALFGS